MRFKRGVDEYNSGRSTYTNARDAGWMKASLNDVYQFSISAGAEHMLVLSKDKCVSIRQFRILTQSFGFTPPLSCGMFYFTCCEFDWLQHLNDWNICVFNFVL